MAAYQGETFFYRESRDAIYHGEVSKSLQMEYNKIALDTPDLLAVLKQRGLQVSNDKEACEILSAIISWLESLTVLRNLCAHHKKTFQELTTDELYELLRVRSEVFVVEQNCVYQDLDGDDQQSIHLWLTVEEKASASSSRQKPSCSTASRISK